MIIETLSTFPHMYDSVMGSSMMQRAQDKGITAIGRPMTTRTGEGPGSS